MAREGRTYRKRNKEKDGLADETWRGRGRADRKRNKEKNGLADETWRGREEQIEREIKRKAREGKSR